MEPQRFYLEDTSVLQHSAAEYMLRLMMAHDVLRSGLRWVLSTSTAEAPAQCTEQLVATLTVAGWVHEVKELLRKGWSSPDRLIEKSLLGDDSKLEAIWDELKKDNSDRMLRMNRIRKKYVFHFDHDGAAKALEYIRRHEPSTFPFFETAETGRVVDSRYPPAYVALGSAFSDGEISESALPAEMKSVASVIKDVLMLLGALLGGLRERMGVSLVPGDAAGCMAQGANVRDYGARTSEQCTRQTIREFAQAEACGSAREGNAMTIARRMAQWAKALKYEDLPEKTIHEVKRRVIDSIATCLGAYGSRPAQVARAKAMAITDPLPSANVWGTSHHTSADLAAFANGAMVRYLDYNDTYLSLEPAHPSDNIPAAVAVTQTAEKNGRDLMLATVIGYEIQCRLCDAASLRAGGWDHVTYGALSTALAAGWLWGLSVDQLEHALGLAGVCNITTRQTRTGQISDWKACAFSNAARNGVFAADLARRGMTGPNEIFEGPKGLMNQLDIPGARDVKLGTGGDFMIDKTYIKFWPAEYHSQSTIDACLQLRPQIEGKEISKIHIDSFEAAVSIIGSEPEKLRPTSRETADHSMFYCCAAALLDGDVTLATFDEKRLTDPNLLDLIDRTTIVEDPELNKGYPKGIPNDITITCADGTKVNKRVDFPRGHAENPMTDEEVVAKFRRLADGVITDATAERILEQAWNLDSMKDVTPLFAFEVIQ